MNPFQRLTSFFNSNTQTKKPNFNVSDYSSLLKFQKIVEDYNNKDWFEQYILYVYKCIEIISDTILNTTPYIVNRDSEQLKNDKLYNDLLRFNSYQTLNEARKIREMHLRLTGAAAWVMQPSDNPRVKYDFYILNPTRLYIQTDKFGLPSHYNYKDGDGRLVRLERDEVIYFRRANPNNWLEGLSQVESVKFTSNAFAAGSQMNMNRLLNNGMPDFLLWFENIGEDQRKYIEKKLVSKYGGIKNNGKQGVMSSTQKPERIDLNNTNKDLEYIEGMKMLRQDILAMFGVPEALVFPSSTNANTKESLKIFQQTTILPALRYETDVFNEQLIPKYYGNNRVIENINFVFDNPVDENVKENAEITKILIESGIITKNEARVREGYSLVSEGDVYINETIPKVEQNNNDDNEELKSISNRIKSIEQTLLKESKETEEQLFKKKALNDSIEAENEVIRPIKNLFFEQAKRFIDKYSSSKPTLRNLPSLDTENAIVAETFKSTLEKIYSNVNSEANVEIKQLLYKVNTKKFLAYVDKALTPEDLDDLDVYVNNFAKEINTTTLNKFKKLVSTGIKEGYDILRFKEKIKDLFNGFVDGTDNITSLKNAGVYEEFISINTNGQVVSKSSNRYNAMLENITKLQASGEINKKEMNKLLVDLKGTLDQSDPIAMQVNQLIENIYGIKKPTKLKESRSTTIARTTSTYTRNLGFQNTYKGNEFIVGKRWVAVGDKFTRDQHLRADNQIVNKESDFVVGGEKLKYPGDPSGSAENIINCRCRITAVVE